MKKLLTLLLLIVPIQAMGNVYVQNCDDNKDDIFIVFMPSKHFDATYLESNQKLVLAFGQLSSFDCPLAWCTVAWNNTADDQWSHAMVEGAKMVQLFNQSMWTRIDFPITNNDTVLAMGIGCPVES